MLIHYDQTRLRDALTDFYNATGISIQLIRPDFSHLGESIGIHNRYCQRIQETDMGKSACVASDRLLLEKCRETRQMQMHVCHAGLVDIAVPFIYEKEILAYIILGQLKKAEQFSDVSTLIEALPIESAEMEACYSNLTVYNEARVKSVASIASMLATYILLEHLLKPNYNSTVERAVTYINAHLDQPLSILQISTSINASKSVLYKNFHATFGCTVSEYINARRIDRAAERLLTSTDSIEEIAQAVGFSGIAYFSKLFKKQKGISPLKFRNTNKQTTGTL